jgi:hypothetical protein
MRNCTDIGSMGFIVGMRAFVLFLNVNALWLVNTKDGLLNYIDETGEMDRYVILTSFNLTACFAFASYLTACLRKPRPLHEMPEEPQCDKCKAWKPMRAHHCSVCKTCVQKMDHHCPWIGTCVGHHNYKAFILFTLYTFANGYWCIFILVSRLEYEDIDLEGYALVSKWILLVFNIPIAIGITGLLIGTFLNVYNNATTLEQMSNEHSKRMPFYGIVKSKDLVLSPNPYDLMWVNNFRAVFGPYLILWPIPFYAPDFHGNGHYYPKLSEFPVEKMGILMRDNEAIYKQTKKMVSPY